MDRQVLINIDTFDFDFWTKNKVLVVKILADRGVVDSIQTLSVLLGLSYASTHELFVELEMVGILERRGRSLQLRQGWMEKFVNGPVSPFPIESRKTI